MNPGRRFLVAAGTVDYPAIAGLPSLPSVKRDLELVVGCLTSGADGYARELREVSQDPQSRRFVDGLTRWMQTGKLQPDDCVVLYYSGHGVMQDNELYLLAADTEGAAEIAGEPRVLGTTAIAASELARAFLGSPVRQLLVIIDTCYSGSALGTFLLQATTRLQTSRTTDGGVAVYVIAAARPNEIANEGAFARAFAELVKNRGGKLGGRIQPYLDPNALVSAMNELSAFKERGQIALYGAYGTDPAGIYHQSKVDRGTSAGPRPRRALVSKRRRRGCDCRCVVFHGARTRTARTHAVAAGTEPRREDSCRHRSRRHWEVGAAWTPGHALRRGPARGSRGEGTARADTCRYGDSRRHDRHRRTRSR